MAALTFSQAVEQAELLARHALPPVQHARLICAVALVKAGQVAQADEHAWHVASTSKPEVVYRINGQGCQCEDAMYRAPRGHCKHVLATLLARKVVALMQAPHEEGVRMPDATDQTTTAVASHESPVVSESPTPPLPEAPASVNVHITVAGRQVQLTLRDTDENRLLARLQAVLERSPLEPAQDASQGERWCTRHNTQMRQTTKQGRSWYSHKTDQGWCQRR
jgi:hypothetical protein